METPGEYK